MIRRPPRSTQSRSSAASDVYKRQLLRRCSLETSTTVCGDKGRCVVCNLRKAGCSLIADCCTTVCGDEGRCVACNLRKEGCSLIANCCDGDRHEIKRESRWLEIGVAGVPSVWPARSYCAQLHEIGVAGVPSVWPARSYCAQLHGAIPSGIRWAAGAFFCSAPAAHSAQGQQRGSSWCWKGGIFRG